MTSGSGGAPSGTGLAERPVLTRAEPVMGTVVSFAVVPGDLPDADLRSALNAACAILHGAAAVFSTWDPRSPVSRLRRGEAGLGQLPADMAEVMALCQVARDASGGWFNPWAMPGGYDPTGLVKGWAVDRALAALRLAGVPAAMVNGGGDLAAFGSPGPWQRWRAGIRHPWRAGALAAIVEVRGAVATSGTYERGAHLVDPRTGLPGSRAASATVTGPSLALADALATAVAVGGDAALEAVAALESYEGYLIRPDGSEMSTGGMAFAVPGPDLCLGVEDGWRVRNDGGRLMVVGEEMSQRRARGGNPTRELALMTVQDQTTAQGVILTDAAAAKVSTLLEQEGRDDLRLRIAVQPGGCSGLRYQLYFDEREMDGDVDTDFSGVHVVTDRMSAPYLSGATIDFVDTIEKQGFTIDNPNATGSCACGDSFH